MSSWYRRLTELRAAGWTVAVHNDYRQDGNLMTFWLLTREFPAIGTVAVKGEGETDELAVMQCALEAESIERTYAAAGPWPIGRLRDYWRPIDEMPPEFKQPDSLLGDDGWTSRKVILWARPCGELSAPFKSRVATFHESWACVLTNGEQHTGWRSYEGQITHCGGDAWLEHDDLIATHWRPWPSEGPDQ